MASYNDLINKPKIGGVTLENSYDITQYHGIKITDSPSTVIMSHDIPMYVGPGELDNSGISTLNLLTTSNLIHESGSLTFQYLHQTKYVDFTRMKNVWFWSVLPIQVNKGQAYSRPYEATLSDTGTNTRISINAVASAASTDTIFNIYIIGEPY